MTDLNAALEAFNTVANKAQEDYWGRMKYTHAPAPKIEYKVSTKYAKFIIDNRSVFCFVDLSNGDILKAASWNAPAKQHARGNIYSPTNGAEALEGQHVRYLK